MEDHNPSLLVPSGVNDDDATMPPQHHNDPAGDDQSKSPSKSTIRGGFAAWRERASLQDKLVEKLLQQVIPTPDPSSDPRGADEKSASLPSSSAGTATASYNQKPNFNITTMSNNFRRFNARIGVVFKFQVRVARVLSWERYSHTLSLLSVYTFVCLDPYLLCVLPLAILILGVLIPAFLARHPAPPRGTLSSEQGVGYSARGPPLAPAATVRPAKELSKDFFRNMRDLQNGMEDFTQAHDQVVALLVPLTNFSNEALSSTVFQLLLVGGVFMTISAQLLPWRFLVLIGGWAAIASGHPRVAQMLVTTREEHIRPREQEARTWVENWLANDVILDSAPETREVEIFELQKISAAGEWEPWLFCPYPYDPLSQTRITGDRPRGSRFFEDISPPEGWVWSEKKWALDLWSREWVEERIITGVEVETEGERWVYDIYDENEERTGVVDAGDLAKKNKTASASTRAGKAPMAATTTWEEGEDADERRGAWRRRRWVRLVKRRQLASMTPS